MDRLGTFASITNSSSTTPFNSNIVLAQAGVGFCSTGQIYIVGITSGYNVFAEYYNFMAICRLDGSLFSSNSYRIYSMNNNSSSASISFTPTNGINTRSELKVTITPGSNTSTRWSVYYKDFYYTFT